MVKIEILKNLNEYNEFVRKNHHVIIKASAEWCGPCKTIKDFFLELANSMPNNVVYGLVDIDVAQDIKRKLRITGVPYFATVVHGELQDVCVGSSRDSIRNLFNKLEKRL